MTQRCRMDAINRWCGGFAILVLISGLLGGCTSLPDTSGFTAATIQLKQAVATSGEVVVAELQSAINAGTTTADDETVERFEAAWKATVNSLEAMVAYAQSIEKIVDAGNKGAESAKQVADSVKKLIGTVEIDAISIAGGKVAKLTADGIAYVYSQYSKHKAANSLEEALDRIGPSMAKINVLVEAQLADARPLFAEQIAAQVDELDSQENGYGDWIKWAGTLNKKSIEAVKDLADAIEAGNDNSISDAKTKIAQIDVGRAAIAPHLAEYEAKLSAIRKREKAGMSILGAAENAVAAWGVAHQQLVEAVKERRPVSMESLIAAVVEVRTLMQRWREL